MRNKELFDKYRDFLIASLNLLKEVSRNGKEIPVSELEGISVQKEKDRVSYIPTLTSEPDFLKFVRGHKNEIVQLKEFDSCFNFLTSLGLVEESKGQTDPKLTERLKETYLISVLVYYLAKTGSLDFNGRIFEEVYGEVENHLYTRRYNFVAIALLHLFEMENGVLGLGDNLRIRKISNEEFSEIYRRRRSLSPMIPFLEAIHAGYLMETTYSIKKGEGIDESGVVETFRKLVSVLRLLKKGEVYFRKVISSPASWQTELATFSTGNLYPEKYGERYKLAKSEVEEFKEFWKDFLTFDFDKNKFLDVAIRRLDYGITRNKPEDKLIDYIIALEALFLVDEGELSYRLSIRTATFLDKNKTVFEDVRTAYSLRNKIVHGSPEPLPGDFAELVSRIEEYLRESIKRFLKMIRTQNHEEIIKSMDKRIFEKNIDGKI